MRIVTTFLVICIFVLSFIQICDFDIWYHLASGKYILQSHQIPRQDVFSYSAQGNPWIAATWLFQLLSYLVYLAGGFDALIISKAIFLALSFLLVLMTMRKRNSFLPISIVVLLLAVAVSRPRFTVRPHILSQFFLAFYAYLLIRFSREKSKLIWMLLPIQVLWVNLHAESVLGVGIVSFYFISELLKSTHSRLFLRKEFNWKDEVPKLRILFVVTVGLFLLSLINPFGWRSAYLGFFTVEDRIYQQYILELRPVYFTKDFLPFWSLFFSGLASFPLSWRRRFEEIIVFAAFSYLAIKTRRFQPQFAIVAAPIVAENLSHSLGLFFEEDIEIWQRGAKRKLANLISCAMIIAFTAHLMKTGDKRMQFGPGVNENIFPKGSVEFIKRENVQGNMFNTMSFGGYLIWHLYPERKVFIDGRTDVYGPDLLYKEVKYREPEIWNALMERFDFNYAVVSNMDELRLYPCENLDRLPNWSLVYWDDTSLLYLKRNRDNKELIGKYAYKYVLPNNPDLSYLDAYLGNPSDKKKVIEEFERNLKGNPRCLLAHTSLAYIYGRGNEDEKAIEHMEKAIEITPYNAELYQRLGMIYQKKGMAEQAMSQYKKALRIDPKLVPSRLNLGAVYFLNEEYKKALYQYRQALKVEPENENIRNNAMLALEAVVREKLDKKK